MLAAVAGPKAPGSAYGQPVAPNLNVRQICPNCRSDPPNIIEEYSKGDLVCADCGTILGDRIVDTRSEWRTFAGDEGGADPSRVGDAGNPLLGSNHLDTVISARDGFTGLSKELQRAQQRTNHQSTGGRGSSTAQLSQVFARISEKCDQMQLPSAIAQRAQHVYKIADEKKVIKHKNETAVIAACIIFACRDAGASRTFQELHKAMKVTKKELFHTFNLVKTAVQEDRAKNGAQATTGIASLESTVEGILSRICNFLDVGLGIYNAAKHIAVIAAEKADIVGRSYNSIATGVLYLTVTLFERKTTAKEIGEVGGVSESTIKLICKKVASKLDDVIRPEWKEQHPAGYNALAALGRDQIKSVAGTPRVGTPVPSENGDAPTPQQV